MDVKSKNFYSEMKTWTFEFRVLFAKQGALIENLDPEVHYILNGAYAATVDIEGIQTWTLVMGVRDNDSNDDKRLLLSK